MTLNCKGCGACCVGLEVEVVPCLDSLTAIKDEFVA